VPYAFNKTRLLLIKKKIISALNSRNIAHIALLHGAENSELSFINIISKRIYMKRITHS
jgi:hypothetical protein